MNTTRLLARLNDTEPKCATCAFWEVATSPRRGDDDGEPPMVTAAACNRNGMKTTNLMACTGWHDRETEAEIL
jgi:hypothetical protein